MRTSLIIFIPFFSLISCKKNPLEPEILKNESYTIEGTMYDKDGKTPLPNYPIPLLAEVQHNFSSSTTEQVSSGSTNENGYFKLTYKGNDDYAYADLGQPSDKLPVFGPVVKRVLG